MSNLLTALLGRTERGGSVVGPRDFGYVLGMSGPGDPEYEAKLAADIARLQAAKGITAG